MLALLSRFWRVREQLARAFPSGATAVVPVDGFFAFARAAGARPLL